MDLNPIGWAIVSPLPRGAHAHESCSVGTHAAQQDGPAGKFPVCIPSGGQEACPWHTDRVNCIAGSAALGHQGRPLAWSWWNVLVWGRWG